MVKNLKKNRKNICAIKKLDISLHYILTTRYIFIQEKGYYQIEENAR